MNHLQLITKKKVCQQLRMEKINIILDEDRLKIEHPF